MKFVCGLNAACVPMVSSSDIQPLNWLLADWQLNVPYKSYQVAPKVLLFISLFVLVCLFLFC